MSIKIPGLLALLLPSATASALELSPLVITATRSPEAAKESLASVSVLTRADLERKQVRSVPDALRGLPGISFSNSGGPGKLTSIALRGTNTAHTLVLIDGVRIGSATTGTAALENLPIEQIDRIEVVRGPRSSLYGADAIGGVIQIFTRKGGGTWRPRLSVGAGTYQSVQGNLGLSGGGDWGWFDASLGFEQTQGFDACRGEPLVGGCFTDEPDRDGYENRSGSLRMGYRFSGGSIGLHWLRTNNRLEFDGITNASKGWQQVLGASAQFKPVPIWALQLSGGRSWDQLNTFSDGVPNDRFKTFRDTAAWQNHFSLGETQKFTLGLDYLRDQVDSTLDFTVDSRDNWGLFGQYQGRFGAHQLTASLRRDWNEHFSDHNTGNLAWGYSFSNGMRLTASYGTAFKAPSFNDLYYPLEEFGGGFGYSGNPDLKPETSRSWEVGIAGSFPRGHWSLNLYQTDLDDLISIDLNRKISMPVNVDQARIRGAEAVLTAERWGWQWNAVLSLLDPRNRSEGDHRDNRLPRRPEQSFRLDLDRDFGAWRLGGSLLLSGPSYDDLANQVRLESYWLLDLRAEYRFSPALRLQARLENLFDERYETVAYYNQPGRGIYLTLRYAPD